MKFYTIFFLFSIQFLWAQKAIKMDSMHLQGVSDAMADDYGNWYLYKNKNFSWTKYDSIGNEIGRLVLPQPYQLQEVQNPLSIPFFSQNAQKLKWIDGHLNEIQTIDFSQKFGSITNAYAEDLQQVWLLDEATNRLIQYFYQEDKIINSYPLTFSISGIRSMLVYKQKIYIVREKSLDIYNFKGENIYSYPMQGGVKLIRENDTIYMFGKNEIWEIELPEKAKKIFNQEGAEILTKNSSSVFVIKENKIYIYPFKK